MANMATDTTDTEAYKAVLANKVADAIEAYGADKADVIVTDGFTGNIVLKMGESIYNIMKEQGMMNEFVENTNYENYGGSPIIGINGNVIIAHGASSPKAIKNMIKLCKSVVDSSVCQKIKAEFEEK